MTDVAIIGAGVIGCSAGLELARRGFDAVVIDGNGDVGHGSTSASCGILRHFYSTPTMTGMVKEALCIWTKWSDYLGVEDESGLARFEQCGVLLLPPAIDDGVRRIVAHMRALDVAVELLTPEQIGARFPFLDTASHWPVRRPDDDDFFEPTGRTIAGGVFEPDAGYVVSPQVATHNLRVAGESAGVVFRLGRRVAAIGREGGRFRLELEDGAVVSADVVLNAAGPHSGVVNRLAGVSLPIETRPLRREVCAVPNPAFGSCDVPVGGDIDSGVYFRPESGGRELIAGSLEDRDARRGRTPSE